METEIINFEVPKGTKPFIVALKETNTTANKVPNIFVKVFFNHSGEESVVKSTELTYAIWCIIKFYVEAEIWNR